MESSTIIWLSIIGILIAYMLIADWITNIKDKSRLKGYYQGENEVTRALKSTAFWFSPKEYQKEFNVLMLYSIIYQKYGSVNSDSFRNKIKALEERNLKDLSQEEIDDLIR